MKKRETSVRMSTCRAATEEKNKTDLLPTLYFLEGSLWRLNLYDEATVLSGTKLANQVLQEVQRDVESWVSAGNKRPHLTVLLVGDNPASHIYVRNKIKAAAAVGISSEIIVRPKDISEEELLDLTVQLNKDSRVSGLLVQLPLPGKDRWLLPRISFWGLKGRFVPGEPWKAGISGRACGTPKLPQNTQGTGICQDIVLKVMAANMSTAFFLS
ncbi:bifunctional protein FolD-like isoform X3 [Chiroxiphia lanceolata]|uniref:bifunctional protein FolD-like isoform X3 n=1 Tax=Chiroxiphia lanceolata TaxID=296741 RepID=UPI0013CF1384|nr:bifunctional protein FolD-like isoform X3 [Chiroxiphia lanceolata]XP_032541526.1 bifunctional protein FolD-like isoform X3 [Chiroxiphia lanceolata]XP_032541527.1 bifunctional protein FolD-like isoform X3 [Chiroxiphia lanceolata]XP_032541528.1 bifunctional protein FolD-like isoform X3 [Chiroxiphia lanceolata]XP_032541529.1 bifunctional protein FolD-like isoform X3 [Chiroxiphia lanceolata]